MARVCPPVWPPHPQHWSRWRPEHSHCLGVDRVVVVVVVMMMMMMMMVMVMVMVVVVVVVVMVVVVVVVVVGGQCRHPLVGQSDENWYTALTTATTTTTTVG